MLVPGFVPCLLSGTHPTTELLVNATRAPRRPIIPDVADARALLTSLQGRVLRTVTDRENRVLGVHGDQVLAWTTRSPAGQPVPIVLVQQAIDRLVSEGEIEISVASVGYRSAFIGAVLRQLPGAEVVSSASPPRIRLD